MTLGLGLIVIGLFLALRALTGTAGAALISGVLAMLIAGGLLWWRRVRLQQ